MKKISNEEIYNKLQEIEDLLIQKEKLNLRFSKIHDWKTFIWEGCPQKAEKITESEIDFFCKILNAPCEFGPCPRNNINSGYE